MRSYLHDKLVWIENGEVGAPPSFDGGPNTFSEKMAKMGLRVLGPPTDGDRRRSWGWPVDMQGNYSGALETTSTVAIGCGPVG